MNHRTRIRGGILLVASLALGGCAVGGTHAYHTVLADPKISGTGQVSVATHDQRPYVLSGSKEPQFVGLMRGGYGNPFDVRTEDGRPLADGMTQAISRSLTQKGFSTVPVVVPASSTSAQVRERLVKAGARRAVLLTLREWKSDTYTNTNLDYDVTLSVLDRTGKVIGEKHLRGGDSLGGSFWNPPGHAREAVPQAFKVKLEQLLSDPQVARALTSTP